MPSLLHVLTRPNVNVDSSLVPTGGNTTVDTDIAPQAWRQWHGFDYATLTEIFRRDLDREYRGSAKHEPLRQDLRIFNEETLEDLLRRFEIPIVNYCLNGRDGDSHFGRGSRCATYLKPDWSVVSPLRVDQDACFLNVLPGDTKLSKKWWPTMNGESRASFVEWQKVVSQVVTYMAYHDSRYGFIISDGCLVALRLTRRRIAEGLVTGRAQRATAGHVRYPSDTSMGGDDSGYQDTNPLHWEYEDPEYVTVPWGAHGSNRLTVKLTLWFLAMMATNGDNFLDYSYPDLDSWRRGEKGYVHNSSGAKKSKLSKGDQAQEPDLGQAEHWEAAAGPSGWGGAGDGREEIPLVDSADEGEEDVPFHSQAGDTFDTAYLPGDPSEGGNEEEEDDDEEDEEAEEKEEGSSRPKKKFMEVKIHESKGGKGLYFLDAKKQKKNTSKEKWTRVEGGYRLEGKKHVYFTKKFP